MNRRTLLSLALASSITCVSSAVSTSSEVTVYGRGSHRAMAAHMMSNYEDYAAKNAKWLDGDDAEFIEPVCCEFARFITTQPSGVEFGVMSRPVASHRGVTKAAASRTIRAPNIRQIQELIDEVPTYHSVDQLYEFAVTFSEECARDVCTELASDLSLGAQWSVCAFFLPPFLSLCTLPRSEFTVDRRWMLRYAKFESRSVA